MNKHFADQVYKGRKHVKINNNAVDIIKFTIFFYNFFFEVIDCDQYNNTFIRTISDIIFIVQQLQLVTLNRHPIDMIMNKHFVDQVVIRQALLSNWHSIESEQPLCSLVGYQVPKHIEANNNATKVQILKKNICNFFLQLVDVLDYD